MKFFNRKLSKSSGALAAVLLFFSPSALHAHRLNMDWRQLENGKILVEVFYSDGKPAREAKIVVRRLDGSEVTRGMADEKGAFEFEVPGGGDLEVEAIHEGAHRATARIRGSPAGEAPAKSDQKSERGSVPLKMLVLGIVVIAVVAVAARLALRRLRAS